MIAAAATAVAQEAKVTPLMTQELAGIAGKEGKMVMVEYAPGGSDAAWAAWLASGQQSSNHDSDSNDPGGINWGASC